ncbi:citrate-binding protein-like [Arachis stenosperma]|uniref:citrate-binding protein-like n=1 Tax=Arachis stenosperma TaxID=217475 RepID=UPI0025AB7CC3|nr:citrate-binding protein-like [Arachis stenosperma]
MCRSSCNNFSTLSISIFFLLLFCVDNSLGVIAYGDPTLGFSPVLLTQANLKLQKPYGIPLDQRYSYEHGIHRLWVYANDKPHEPTSRTQPRTEIRISGLDYKSGVWQFEGYGFIPNGTSGATIAQIYGAAHGATTLILRIYNNGEMRYYSRDLVAENLYDKWFRLNIIHDVDGGTVSVFIDGKKKFHTKDKGPGDLYFKCGVYAAPANISYYMESRWRDIKIYRL